MVHSLSNGKIAICHLFSMCTRLIDKKRWECRVPKYCTSSFYFSTENRAWYMHDWCRPHRHSPVDGTSDCGHLDACPCLPLCFSLIHIWNLIRYYSSCPGVQSMPISRCSLYLRRANIFNTCVIENLKYKNTYNFRQLITNAWKMWCATKFSWFLMVFTQYCLKFHVKIYIG